MKTQLNIRVSKLTKSQIDDLIEQTGMSQTELVSTAIDRMYREEIKMDYTHPLMDDVVDGLGADNPQMIIDEYGGKTVKEILADLETWADPDGETTLPELAQQVFDAIKFYNP